MNSDNSNSAKPKRRWCQFSLRTLLIFTTVIAIWLAWWSYKARQQQAAVAKLKERGAEVFYDFEEPLGRGLEGPAYYPEWLVNALGVDYFATVMGVDFRQRATNSDLIQLNELGPIQILWLDDSMQVTDSGLKSLRGMTTLRILRLDGTQVTDDGLRHIEDLTALKRLYLDDTKVSDAGVARLQKSIPKCSISRHSLSRPKTNGR